MTGKRYMCVLGVLQTSPVLKRVPSPQELIVHTQAIMQNALLKKQLEDQKERFLKRQQGKSPQPEHLVTSSTPATTPAAAQVLQATVPTAKVSNSLPPYLIHTHQL